MELLRRRIATEKGAVMVDAAITMPLFIIAIAMLLMAIRIMNIEENKTYQMVTENEVLSEMPGLAFTVNDPARELYIDRVCYNVKILNNKFPFKGAFFSRVVGEITLPYRGFVGESDDPYDSQSVVIFPKNEGSEKTTPKYHGTDCWQLKAHRKNQMELVTRAEAEQRGYSPCLICGGRRSTN